MECIWKECYGQLEALVDGTDEFRATNDGKSRSTSVVLATHVWSVVKPAENTGVFILW